MADLASLDNLADRLDLTVAELNLSKANLALANASGIVRSLSGPPRQDIEFVSQETIELRGGTQTLTLPQRPAVVDVGNPLTVVEVGGFGAVDSNMVEGQDFERSGNELRRGYPWLGTSRLMGWPNSQALGTWAQTVRVTYSHGYATIPSEIVSITLDIAQHMYDNPLGARALRIDDYSEDYATETLGALTTEGIRSRLAGMGYRRGSHSIIPS